MKKVVTWFKWCAFLLILGVLLWGGMKYLGHDWQLGHSNGQAVSQEHFSSYQGPWNERQNMNSYDNRRANHDEFAQIHGGHAYPMHKKHWISWMLPFILGCGLVIVGWRWVKRSEGNRLKKWLGMTLILLALLPLIGPIIGISIMVLLFFLITRYLKDTDFHMNPEPLSSFYNSEMDSPYRQEGYTDFLDEWEKEMLKKKRKKEEDVL